MRKLTERNAVLVLEILDAKYKELTELIAQTPGNTRLQNKRRLLYVAIRELNNKIK